MSLSSLEHRLLDHVGKEPDSATVIWRRFYGLPEGNLTITRRMKRERRTVAAMLEDLAQDGYVTRTEIERHGATIPAYHRGPKQHPDTDWEHYVDEAGWG